jgi:rhodanese-related sulfurtransferase
MDNQKTRKVSNNNLLLDIRNHDEIDSVKYNNNKKTYKTVLYIPSNIIKYNLEFLFEYFKQYDNVYIICRSGTRSKKIKDKYFMEYDNVFVNSKHFDTLENEYTQKSPGLHLSLARKIQIISGSIILVLFSLLFFHNNVKYIFLLFGFIMIYVGISGNCFMASILTKNDM